ncbi:mitochondrial substrate carrier family protein [Cladochytrium replicatum]|nr:mitochondrial substrate carrier family protein [Cladochytrium replicatum]
MTVQEPPLYAFVFGGISCMVAAAATNPVDVIKVRLQLQGENVSSSVRYAGFLRGMMKIAQEEGVSRLFSGLSPSLLREATYSTLRMGFYPFFKSFLQSADEKDISLTKKVVAAGAGGAVAAMIASPSDLVKVRMQAVPPRYHRMRDAFIEIAKTEGWKGFYRGVSPNTQRAIFVTGSQLPSYDQSKRVLLSTGYFQEGFLLHSMCSMVSGLVAATASSPMDVVKSRFMNQEFVGGKGSRYSSTWDCLVKTVRGEGIRGLFSGWLPNWLRLGPHTYITFVTLEALRVISGLKPV